MRSIPLTAGLLAILVVGPSCSDDATEPETVGCTAETASVTATVSSGATPTFNWEPRCAVAIVLVEEDASDQWGLSTDEESWTNPTTGNRITPPITYGTIPQGTVQTQAPQPLVTGRTYELILWRVLPPGSSASCLQKIENLCLLTVHEFTR